LALITLRFFEMTQQAFLNLLLVQRGTGTSPGTANFLMQELQKCGEIVVVTTVTLH
jgi:hypothetical protein